jgi:hypothetical protein
MPGANEEPGRPHAAMDNPRAYTGYPLTGATPLKPRGTPLIRALPLVAALALSALLAGCAASTAAHGATFTGTAEPDTILGTNGYDTYVIHRGGGHDTIETNTGGDHLQLHPAAGRPLAKTDVHFVRDQKDLVVWMGAPNEEESDSIRVKKWFETTWPTHRLGLIALAGPDRKTAAPDSTVGGGHAWLTPEVSGLADPNFNFCF